MVVALLPATPVTMPDKDPTVAIVGAADCQVPPVIALERVMVKPLQTTEGDGPVIGDMVFTVMLAYAVQEVPSA
jgi:hypothetical protein